MEHIFTFKGQGVRYPNEYYKVADDEIWILIKSKRFGEKICIIDAEDFDRVNKCNWKVRRDCETFYVLNSNNGFIHRLINNCPEELQVDHVDGNGLYNKKINLNNVTAKQNSHNYHVPRSKTGVLGVSYEGGRYDRYRTTWVEDGKKCTKDFAVSKYGEDALKMAEEYRKLKEESVYKDVYYGKLPVSTNGSTIMDLK